MLSWAIRMAEVTLLALWATIALRAVGLKALPTFTLIVASAAFCATLLCGLAFVVAR